MNSQLPGTQAGTTKNDTQTTLLHGHQPLEPQPEVMKVKKQVFPFLNISLYLNSIKPIKSLTIENTADDDLSGLEVKISADIPCIEAFKCGLALVPARREVIVPLESLKVNRDYLSKLSETEIACITIDICGNGLTLVKETFTIEVHPIEHFGGFQVLPELIAAYVTPNHPYVYHIKRKAADILEKQGLRAAFEGYQPDDPERVLQIMSALYSAIQSEDIVYSSLPPGYEDMGQRLRLLNTIQRDKFANCIDMSLLYAACLEAVDLNPILVVVRGHAFVGCWLHDDKFSETINDDKAAITKRLSKGIREMAVVEATSLCRGNNIRFSDALNAGEAQLVEKEDFILSIDIKRARTLRIRPLPLLTDAAGIELDEEVVIQSDTKMENRFEIGTIYNDDLLQGSQPKTKQKVWERKLLDLSLRNSLLNLRMTRNMLQLVDIDISHLEDTLSDGKSFSILPNPHAEIQRKYNLFTQPLHHSSPLYELANDELRHNRLLTHYHQQDLDSILQYMHKNAKQAIEENGSSTLYLAVGLLKWFDVKSPDQPRYAPVLLLPVEINRRSVNSKFTLKSRGEEAMINITLIEFLRQEYELNLSALEQLPTDDKGVDVAKVMGVLRRAVMQLKGWDVEEQLVLGNFSFSKLILWKDIVMHQEELIKSPMVRSLIEGKLAIENSEAPHLPHEFDKIPPQSLILPIPTDVSQMEAVLAAQNGSSYILHGPPGTGKSQTITNIIADALYHNRRVLFVAAKKAALDVVHNRLAQIGLAPFSLELHSNKSKKSDVLEQLSKSLETSKLARSADFEQEAQRLHAAKSEISSYINILHHKQPSGLSLYDSITSLENYRNTTLSKNFIPEAVLQQLTADQLQKWADWLPQFESIIKHIVHPADNPLAEMNLPPYSLSVADEISTLTQQLLGLLPEAQSKLQQLTAAIRFPFSVQSTADWEQFLNWINAIYQLQDMPLQVVGYLADKENLNGYYEWSKTYRAYLIALSNILKDYNRNVLSADLTTTEIHWKRAQQSWFLSKWLLKRKIKKQLSVFKKAAISDDSEIDQLFHDHNQLLEVQQVLQQARMGQVQQSLKNLFRDEQTDLDDIDSKAAAIQQLTSLTDHWERNGLRSWIEGLEQGNIQYVDEVKKDNLVKTEAFRKAASAFDDQREEYRALTGITFIEKENMFETATTQLQNIQTHLPNLRNWMNYLLLRKQGEALQLQWLITAYENKICNADNLADYYAFTVHASLTQRIISQHESLSLFNAGLFESKVDHYKNIAKTFQQLTIQELRVKLAAQLPNTSVEAMQSSEIGILQRAIKNKGRGMSIRKLFDQIPALLPRLAPCMLMSPISVAQYFDVNTDHFDLVIFDEASQLPTCEAVSALARAKQCIIVGDPKQMPPTSFFSTIKLDEENMDVEDLESILDDCLSLSMPSKYLLRHYRSKHESLIAFSNVNYYDSKLLTFPSSDDLNRKVKYHHIEGFYDKGKTRTNKFEADAIVQYIQAHYNDPDKRRLSIGVVTFSQTQQNLIEDKLQKLFMVDPKLEEFANENEEPLFVKNLENVQGDERDIILFSICYAPDEEGKMSMNFGPLNRDGGWRRLNVAITRARYEMHLFATLQPDQIDLNRTSAEGVAGLKAFIQFAAKGTLSVRPDDIQQVSRNQLSAYIKNKLEDRGLKVKCNIGTSGYKIDIGIVHPEKPQQYILGIVIDGEYYYNAHTTNDREMVMPSVLKSLGWNIHRIWTMDWHENSSLIIDAILDKVGQLQTQPDDGIMDEPVDVQDFEPVNSIAEEVQVTPVVGKQKPYISHIVPAVTNANSETIFDFQNRNAIKEQIRLLVNTEAPISKALLYKKVLQAWNTSRAGSRLDKHLEGIIAEMDIMQTVHQQPFYWNGGVSLDYYRSNDVEKRNMEDIAPEEIRIALEEVVATNFSIDEDELLRYLARTFGFAKVGKQIDAVLRYVIDTAVQEGKVVRDNSRIKYVV